MMRQTLLSQFLIAMMLLTSPEAVLCVLIVLCMLTVLLHHATSRCAIFASLHYPAQCCTILHWIGLHCAALHCCALLCTALHFAALHSDLLNEL